MTLFGFWSLAAGYLLLIPPVAILLLDEASSALDQANKQAVVEFIREAGDLTVLSVAHDAEWLGFADRVVNLADGACKTGDRQ